MTYYSELTHAMTMLGQDKRVLFLGQAVAYPGTGMSDSFANVPRETLLELPVAEDMQMGMSIGLSLAGVIPVSVYPRWNFLLLAANQLVNHLDRLPLYSEYRPKVIIRVAVPSRSPIDAGPQHTDDFTQAFNAMCKTVVIYTLGRAKYIMPCYERALQTHKSTVLVEYVANYGNEE